MYPTLLHIYGPFALHSFSVAIAVGIALFIYNALKHPGFSQIMPKSQFINFILEGTLISLIGGRVLYCFEEWHSFASVFEMFYVWNKGLSSLGCVVTALIYLSWYLKRNTVPVWQLCDVIGLYAPIIHICTRIGCFLAGCCFGKVTQLPWGITYTNPAVIAPINIKLHPTQLYSVLIFLGIYIFLYQLYKRQHKAGQIAFSYLFLSSLERLSLDFIRGDRVIHSHTALVRTDFLSFDQWIAIGLCLTGIVGFVYVSSTKRDQARSALS